MSNKYVFQNLLDLKRDMEVKRWCVDSFVFRYNQNEYIVLVGLYDEEEEKTKPQYAITKIEFIRRDNIRDRISGYADLYNFYIDKPWLFRDFFNIEYCKNSGNIFQQFTKIFAPHIPTQVKENKSNDMKGCMLNYLRKKEANQINNIYCYDVRRNGKRADGKLIERTPVNDNKARLLRPELYNIFYKDRNISFYFSENPEDERTDEEIVYIWSKRNKH